MSVVLVRFILNRGKLDGAKMRVGVRNLRIKMKKIHLKVDKQTFPKYKGKAAIDCCTEDVGARERCDVGHVRRRVQAARGGREAAAGDPAPVSEAAVAGHHGEAQ